MIGGSTRQLSSFGKTGGEIFDAGSVKVDTVVVDRVVRDTLLVRDTTVIVSEPDTVYRKVPRLLPSITVEPGGWQEPFPGYVQAVCELVQKTLTASLVFALDSDIVVRHVEPGGPKVLYPRTPNGSYVIWLDTEGGRGSQNAFQFAHEYGHLLSNYYQIHGGQNQWFDESLSSMASLYVLRKIQFHDYIRQAIPGHRMEDAEFKAWFEAQHAGLTQDPYIRRANDQIAHNLIDIFMIYPDAWNAVRYLNIQGPVSWDHDQDFDTHLRGWYLRTPARWQKYVVEIARRFGYFPASKPALAGTEGVR